MSEARYASKRKRTPLDEDPPRKLQRRQEHFSYLPDEMLVHIFSFLSQVELYRTARPVCRRWQRLASAPLLWRRISVGNEIPAQVLSKWLTDSIWLRDLHIKERRDTDDITAQIAKSCPHLQSIRIERCRGSERRRPLNSTNLCRMVSKCKQLNAIHFDRVCINSCRFFKLLSLSKLRTKKKWSYSGPVSIKQMNILLEAVVTNNCYDAAISLAPDDKKISLKELTVMKSDNSIDIPKTLYNIWEHIKNELEEDDEEYLP